MSGRHIPTILCIDDNIQLLAIRTQLLESRGYRVFATDDVEKAFSLVERESIDVVILDYRMRPIDGEGAALGIKARKPALPIILLSGFPSRIPEHLLYLVDAFVPKGQPVAFLLSAIEAVVHTKLVKKPVQSATPDGPAHARQVLARSQNIIRRGERANRDNIASIQDYRRRSGRSGR